MVVVCCAYLSNLGLLYFSQLRLCLEYFSFVDFFMLTEVWNGPLQIMVFFVGNYPQGTYITRETENGCDYLPLDVRVAKKGPKRSTPRIQRQPKIKRGWSPWERPGEEKDLAVHVFVPSTGTQDVACAD